jgi:hypothetical protein
VTPSQQIDDAEAWGTALAGRLRLIQAGLVEEPEESRRAFLADEVERSLKAVPPSRKASFLESLERHFPAWLPEERKSEEKREATLEELLSALSKVAGNWTEAERLEMGTRLAEAKIIAESAKPAPAARYDELWRLFGRMDAATPHSERSLRLLALLAELFMALDQLSWTLWRSIGQKSAYKKEFDFGKLAGPYLTGDPEVSTDHMRQAIERTRRLIAALLGASGRAAAEFAVNYNRTFGPDTLEGAARQRKSTFESVEAASWREYKTRFEAVGSAPHIEAAIQSAVAQAAEDLIGGRAR